MIENIDEQTAENEVSDEIGGKEINEALTEAIDYLAAFAEKKEKKLCGRFFSKTPNKNFLASVAALKQMIALKSNLKPSFSKQDIMEFDDEAVAKREEKIEFDEALMTDALKSMRCNKLINHSGRTYQLNEKLWEKGVRHKIRDKLSLQPLVPALIAYVKHDLRYMPNDFFKMLTPLCDFLLKPTSFHNTNLEIEKYIYDTINKNKTVVIKTDLGKEESVFPSRIVIHGNVKRLEYYLDKKDINEKDIQQSYTTNIKNIVMPKNWVVPVIAEVEPMRIKPLQQNLWASHKFPDKIPNGYINVILAVSEMAYEYFSNIEALEYMHLMTNPREIYDYLFEHKIDLDKLFVSLSHKEAIGDFFLVFGTGHKELVLDVIQKNINYVKVLQPSSGELEQEIAKRYKVFQKNAKIPTEKENGFHS